MMIVCALMTVTQCGLLGFDAVYIWRPLDAHVLAAWWQMDDNLPALVAVFEQDSHQAHGDACGDLLCQPESISFVHGYSVSQMEKKLQAIEILSHLMYDTGKALHGPP